MKKKVLITGANGQLGHELQELSSDYPQFDFFLTDVDSLNLCNPAETKSFLTENPVDYVINCAAYTAVDRAEEEEELCYQVNRDAVQNLAESAEKQTRIIHISTDYVFDGAGKIPLKESDETNPQSVYGKSKLAGEEILMKIRPESIVVRTSWLYSRFGNNFVKTMIRLGEERDIISVVSDQIGTPTAAADLGKAILEIILWRESTGLFPPGIYHYSNAGFCSWYDFTLKIHELAGIRAGKVHPVPSSCYPTKAKRPLYSVFDKTKIQSTFQLTIPSWEESLERMMRKQ